MKPRYADLGQMTEDDRIKVIGEVVMMGQTVGIWLETNQPDKIARYIRKVQERYPAVTVVGQYPGCPTPLVTTIKFKLG